MAHPRAQGLNHIVDNAEFWTREGGGRLLTVKELGRAPRRLDPTH